MTKTLHLPVIYQPLKSTHEQTGIDEFLDPISIALSDLPNNSLVRRSDGLYVGPYFEKSAFYVAASGNDVPTAGDQATPYKTLDYCMAQINAKTAPGVGYNNNTLVALKAGETFNLTNTLYMRGGKIAFTFFGDPQYGDFYGPLIGGITFPALMADLQRPIINVGIVPATVGGCAGIVIVGNEGLLEEAQPSTIILTGVQVNLPGGAHGTGSIDFIKCVNGGIGTINLDGAIINITDVSSQYGFVGLEAWSECKVYQFASQFRVLNTLVAAGDPVANLVARKWFIKFYQDFLGNNQTGLDYTGNTSTPGSALMKLSWSDTPALPVIPTKTNQATYPVLADPATGMTNYFFNLTRDQQQRAQNVWSSRPF